ncbi:MAG: DUF790 family protein [Acidobacteria bacterium]|nr:DUF790 family protein [Acidobacteriota bacterium]
MLTGDLAISFQRGETVTPKSLKTDDARVLQTAADLILLVRQHANQSRGALQAAFDEYIGVGTDYKILRGLMKLLLDACEFSTSSVREAIDLRRTLFNHAATVHPVTDEAARQQALAHVAEQLGCQPHEIIAGLYSDLPAHHLLTLFDEPEPRDLLEQYNLAQVQALLYHCIEIRLTLEPAQSPTATQSIRAIFQAIKNYRLIHAIRGNARAGYEIRLSGPVSLFHRSQKYGIQMAVFFPALLPHPGWHLRAEIETKRGRAYYELNHAQHQLRSSYLTDEPKPQNELLEKLRAQWRSDEWQLADNHEILPLADTALIPDLVFTHSSGQRVYAELLGYWTPRYLQERLIVIERAAMNDYLYLASDELRCSREEATSTSANLLVCKAALKAKDIELKLKHWML